MIDLTSNPFFLSPEAIQWVEDTKANMSLDEKLGQLFVPIGYASDPSQLEHELLRFHIGGVMYRCGPAKEMQQINKYLQTHSKIPLLIGANLESGGIGIAQDGTAFGRQMQVAATLHPEEYAYYLGKVSCSEGHAVGCNWAFAPVVDIDRNYHNPITNVRTFGNDPALIKRCALAYKRAADEEKVAIAAKHFPGDGCDEVDQHLLVSVNELSLSEWNSSYGMIYQALIDAGSLSIMVGHIAQPAYQELFDGGPVNELIPATLSASLLQKLLRGKLGFNGLITTDSTCMVGFNVLLPRRMSVPYSIEAGCDTFLFNKDLEEDFHYMKEGYCNGILSEKRLDEALTRILATKAALGLHLLQPEDRVPSEAALSILQHEQHLDWARSCADEAVTLVKDTQSASPLSPKKTPRILLEILGNYRNTPRILQKYVDLLQENGFKVTVYERETRETADFRVETLRTSYDLVLYIGDMETGSNQVTNRYQWFTFFGNGNNCPWFTAELPVVYISHANPYALLDAPQIKTYINAYSTHDLIIDAVVQKLLGHSSFLGHSPIDPFCGKTHLSY